MNVTRFNAEVKKNGSDFKEIIPTFILFIFAWSIVSFGALGFLFFISDFIHRCVLSVAVGLGLSSFSFYFYFEQRKKYKLLKDALQVLTYLDPKGFYHPEGFAHTFCYGYLGGGYMPKLRDNSLQRYNLKKDIPLGLILEDQDILHSFSNSDKEFSGFEGAEKVSVCDFNHRREKLANILGQLNGYEWLYKELHRLDDLIQENIEYWIKRNFPKQVYFLRFHLLRHLFWAWKQGKYLFYGGTENLLNSVKFLNFKCDEEELLSPEKAIVEFCKLVLNKYYSEYKEYDQQPVNLDLKLFKECFVKADKEEKEEWPDIFK